MKAIDEKQILGELAFLRTNPHFDSWYLIVKDILLNEEFQKRRYFKHHDNSVWDHSILVSFIAYRYSFYFKANSRICAIAGLLHDFYPYAWQYSKELEDLDSKYLKRYYQKRPLLKKHGFIHAKEAAYNYLLYFPNLEDKRITNSIKRHMFPLNLVPPRYKEGWIVTLADKLVAFKEVQFKDFIYYCGIRKK